MDPMLMMLVLFVVMLLPMWLMGRSQKKRMQQHQELVKSFGVGDEVRTAAGFYGMIVEEDGDTVILESESGAQLKWARAQLVERVASYGQEHSDEAQASAHAETAHTEAPHTDTAHGGNVSHTTEGGSVAGVTVEGNDR